MSSYSPDHSVLITTYATGGLSSIVASTIEITFSTKERALAAVDKINDNAPNTYIQRKALYVGEK